MSRTHDMDCDQVRKQAYRYRRNELIGAETSAIEAHTDSCATCRDYYERLGILLDSASAWEPSEEASDADDLFAGIAARIEAADEPDVEPDVELQEHDGVADEDDEVELDYDFGRRRWVSGVVGLAAGVLLTLVGFYLFEQFQDSVAPGESTTVAGADEETAGEGDLEELARQESSSEQVEVFASNDADWTLVGGKDAEDKELVLELERGTLLVEFVPKDGRTLRVEAPDMSVRVVGTVFYVSTDDGPRAGVLAGEVEVSSPDGETATLESERELGAGFEVREMPEARRASLARHVDPQAHLAKLAGLERPKVGRKKRVRRPDRPASGDTGVQKAVEPDDNPEEQVRRLPPDLERLRARAERATRQGSYHDAIRYYRSLLDRLPPVHPIAASVHLDLAHIYLHRLNSPGRAAPYLRTFVERWPSDVAADSARRELCKIDASEPGCEVDQ